MRPNKNHLLLLAIFCIPLFFLNISDKLSYGDDWAQYVKEAMNIVAGKPFYHSGYVFNAANIDYAPPFYTVGFPLLLAPVIRCFGSGILPMLYFNAVMLCLLLFASYSFLKTKTSSLYAALIAIIFIYSSVVLDLKSQVLSDIPCALFMVSYYAVRENRKQWTFLRILVLSVLAAYAILIRIQAFILVFAEIYFLLRALWGMRKNNLLKSDAKYYSLFLLLVFLNLYIVNNWLFPAPKVVLPFFIDLYKYKFTHPSMLTFMLANANYSYSIIADVLYHKMNVEDLQFLIAIICSSSVFLALAGWVVYIKKYKLDFITLVFIFSCGLMLLSPGPQGLRYFLPAIPILLLFMAKGMGLIAPLVIKTKPAYIAIACLVIFLALGYDDYEHSTRGPSWTITNEDTQAFEYVKNHVEDSAVVLYMKPRLLTLLSNKKSANISWQQTAVENREQFKKLDAKYFLFCRHLNMDVINEYLTLQPATHSDSVIINSEYVLYTLNP